MKIKVIAISLLISSFTIGCGGNEKPEKEQQETQKKTEHKKEKEEDKITESKEPTTDTNKGIGPIKSIILDEINDELVEKGKEIYKANCTACHKIGKRSIGPALQGITERRSPEWIMNMILNPEEMVEKDPVAKALLAEYIAPMANQSLKEEEARAILEFFRTKK